MRAFSDNYVFMHIPKTAGMSIRTLLEEAFAPGAVSEARGVRPIGPDEARELDAYRIVSEHLSEFDVARFFATRKVFTFLRDPMDRCLSIYGYFRQLTHFPLIPLDQIRGANNAEEATSLARQLEPDDFFCSDHPHVRQNLENRMTWQVGYRAGIEHRGEISPADALERAKRALDRYIFIGLFENLATDAARLRRVLGAPDGGFSLPSVNRTTAPLRRRDIGPVARAAIERSIRWDRRLYDHALGLVDGRHAAA